MGYRFKDEDCFTVTINYPGCFDNCQLETVGTPKIYVDGRNLKYEYKVRFKKYVKNS